MQLKRRKTELLIVHVLESDKLRSYDSELADSLEKQSQLTSHVCSEQPAFANNSGRVSCER